MSPPTFMSLYMYSKPHSMVYDITDLEVLQICIRDPNKNRSAVSRLHLLLAKVRSVILTISALH